mmetsp:Transcript_8642/g.15539  ORF Transcript_8642/g.15539 Transcript_8642/m.15539 type:complete len:235 (-) Transcript_8642:126-830(-)
MGRVLSWLTHANAWTHGHNAATAFADSLPAPEQQSSPSATADKADAASNDEPNYGVQVGDSSEKLPGALQDDLEHQGPRVFKEYKLYVDTAKHASAGARADVFIQMYGDYGKTGLIRLKKVWAPGTRIQFSVFAPDVGKVEAMRVMADTEDAWGCDRLWLQDINGIREFPVGRIIGWPNTPEVTVGPALSDDMGQCGVLLALAMESVRWKLQQAGSAAALHNVKLQSGAVRDFL